MGKATLNVIRDLECSYTIHGTVEYVSVKENYVEYKDELPEGMVQTTNASSDFRNMNYKTVVSELKKMGFTNIVKKPIKMGFFNKEGEVDSISVNGKKGSSEASFLIVTRKYWLNIIQKKHNRKQYLNQHYHHTKQ